MAEYIEREALRKRLEDFSEWCRDGRKEGVDFVLDCSLPNTPAADVVEVVRCKDCKFFIPDAELDHNKYPNIIEADGLCNNSLKFTYADDFCSHGERKEV